MEALSPDAQHAFNAQLCDAVAQMDWLRKAQLVQLHLTGGPQAAQAAPAPAARPADLSHDAESVLCVLFGTLDILNGPQLDSLATMTETDPHALSAWLADKRQACRAVCNRVKKRSREAMAARGSRRGTISVRKPGFSGAPAFLAPGGAGGAEGLWAALKREGWQSHALAALS